MKKGESSTAASRETVGKIATDLASKESPTRSPIELMQEMLTDYEKNFWECVTTHKQRHGWKDFYIVVITKKEKLLVNVLRNYFLARLSCPTPDYDQIVYKYTGENDHVEILWGIPARDVCIDMLEHVKEIPPSEHQLLHWVIQFASGKLFEEAKRLNNEVSIESPLLST